MNNTARQAGTTLGVALFGAIAGPTAPAAGFVAGLHRVGVLAAALWGATALVTLATVDWSHPLHPHT